jgi:hypothetical protein
VQEFLELYDYLVWKDTPTNLTRPSASVTAKYYKAAGGDWTVEGKRIPLRHVQDVQAPTVRAGTACVAAAVGTAQPLALQVLHLAAALAARKQGQ